MIENAAMDYEKQRTVAILLSAGVNPKYRAFAYIVYLVRNFDSDTIMSMSNKQLIDIISEQFSVRTDKVIANFKCLMEACAYSGGRKSVVFSLMPRLGKHEYPSIYEFMVVLSCYIDIIDNYIINDRKSDFNLKYDMYVRHTDADNGQNKICN